MKESLSTWLCFQIGAREHYAIPRALHHQGQLGGLITDFWVRSRSPLNYLPKSYLTNLRERFHPELADASVYSFNQSLFQFELAQKIKTKTGWEKIIAHNHWFQEQALEVLKKYTHPLPSQTTIFAYSYAALKLFRYAKAQGWKTVLGQIDAGLVHQEIIQQKFVNYPNYHENFELAPAEYWQDWLEECFLADKILVNSSWSKKALEKKGMPNKKIYIVPLAYQNSTFDHNFIRKYPPSFSHKRPLKVLFLGRITLGKGIAALLEATELLQDEPIEFWFVGSVKIQVPQRIKDNKKIKFLGAVSRSTTAQYYQQADLFLFPTLSDGFGLTQLEAQAWQLPIIASPFCGEVVKDNINGLTLPEVNGNEITKALSFCLKNPNKLQNFARNSHDFSEFSLDNLQEQLVKLDLERKD